MTTPGGTAPAHDYLTHWRLARPVFRRGHGDGDVFFPPSYHADLRRLSYYLGKGAAGAIVVAMPPGQGKSTLARHLYQSLDMERHEAILLGLYQAHAEAGWLLPKLARFLGVAPDVEALGHALDELAEEKRHLTLLVDDADRLTTPEAFSELHAILGLPNVRAVELSVVLFGATGWEAGPLRQSKLAPHVRLAVGFPAYGRAEAEAFIADSLAKAGMSPDVLPGDAREAAFAASQGHLARLALILENALVEAALAGKTHVDRAVVASVLAGMGSPLPEAAPVQAPAPAAKPTPDTTAAAGPTPAEGKEAPTPGKTGLRALFLKNDAAS